MSGLDLALRLRWDGNDESVHFAFVTSLELINRLTSFWEMDGRMIDRDLRSLIL